MRARLRLNPGRFRRHRSILIGNLKNGLKLGLTHIENHIILANILRIDYSWDILNILEQILI
jgi:hypothetical protein